MSEPEKKFEVALADLEKIVSKLESTQLPLEESLDLFEKGISLSKVCTQKLSEAEKKVDLLLEQLAKSAQATSRSEPSA